MKKLLIILLVFLALNIDLEAQDTLWGKIPVEYSRYIHRDISNIYLVADENTDLVLAKQELDLFAVVWGLVPMGAMKRTEDTSTIVLKFVCPNEDRWELLLGFKNKNPADIGLKLISFADFDTGAYEQFNIGTKVDKSVYINKRKNIYLLYPRSADKEYTLIKYSSVIFSYQRLLDFSQSYVFYMVDKYKREIKKLAKVYKRTL